MNTASFEALSRGIEGYRRGVDSAEDKKLRAEMLKRQIEQDKLAEEERQFGRTMRTKQIELAERGDKRESHKLMDEQTRGAMDDVLKQIEASRRGQETGARVDLLKAQAAATAAKPTSPLAAQLEGMDDFGSHMTSALTENNEAMQAQRLAYQSPDPAARAAADQRVLKAQIKLSGLSQIAQGWQKNIQKEPTVDLEFPGEDGVSKMKMRVPQSQWNESHPMWGKFSGGGAAAPAGAQPAGGPPPAAIAMLKKNPNLAAEFDKKFGAGQAQRILSAR